jgi:hypothetical protein
LRTFIVKAVVRYRILTVGTDVGLLSTRQALLTSHGYDSLIVTPGEFDEKVRSDRFDLVILSAMLSQGDRCHIQAELPASARPLVLDTLVWPDQLLRLVSEALGQVTIAARRSASHSRLR